MTDRLQWRELHLPSTVAPAAMRAILIGWGGLPSQPRLVLETVVTAGRLRWRIGADQDLPLRRACHVVTTHLPEAVIMPLQDWPSLGAIGSNAVAAQVRVSQSRHLPLDDHDIEAAARSVVSALAVARRGEALQLQLILGARTSPTRPPRVSSPSRDEPGLRRQLHERSSQPGFGCAVRIAASAADIPRAHALVASVGGAMAALNAPGVRVRLSRSSIRTVATAASPFVWPLWLSVDDLGALTGWPISSDKEVSLPGVAARHPKVLTPSHHHPKTGVIVGDAVLPAHPARPIGQSARDALQHRHVMGPTGVGKSTLLAGLVLQDIEAGRGAVVVDPKGDLVTDILARIPDARVQDVVVLDAASPTPMGLNPLSGRDPDLAADGVLAVFHSLYGDGLGPRSSDILHAACLTLARRGDGSLPMIPILLTNPGFRRSVIGRVVREDRLGLGAFWAGFDAMSAAERDAAVRPLLNKLRPILLRPSLRAVFGQVRPALSLEEILAGNKILLVRLGKDRIGPEAAQLLGSLLVTQLWQAILSRLSQPASRRAPVSVVIDEVQDYLRLPGSLGDALAQARGLGIGITAAHQHRAQLGRLVDDLDANTATKLFFRLAPADARAVATQQAGGALDALDFASLPASQVYARLLVGGDLTPWVSVKTRRLSQPRRDPIALQASSEARYGRALSDVERDLLSLIDQTGPGTAPDDQTAATTPPSMSSEPHRLGRRRPSATHQVAGGESDASAVDDGGQP